MKKILVLTVAYLLVCLPLMAQTEPGAGKWKTWFISSGKDYRLPAPTPTNKKEIDEIVAIQNKLNAGDVQQIRFWHAGAPGYRWHEMITKIWVMDTGRYGALANMLLATSIYDATVVAWDTKYTWKRPRPFGADRRIKNLTVKPESPGYPDEYAIAAGAAITIFSKFYPQLTDSVSRMAHRAMQARLASGNAFQSDIEAGFELGKKVALVAIDKTKHHVSTAVWDGKTPAGRYWTGKFALFPMAGKNRTIVLDSANQFRPPAPPDFAKDMEELKNFKQNFRSRSNAFLYANQSPNDDALTKKIFEYNIHLNPAKAARIYAAAAVAAYDGFTACWDAKYTYWGIRPDQYDSTYKPLIGTPPFPGYPSGHAVMGGLTGELYSYFFPLDEKTFRKNAKDGAESRFHAGIHFRTDNEVALELGRKVAVAVIERLKQDGADQ